MFGGAGFGGSSDSPLERNGFEPPVPRQIGNGFEASSKWSRSTIGATVSSEQLPASRQTDRVVGPRFGVAG
jgi:hypothetical protein